jgi:hypothetical protein
LTDQTAIARRPSPSCIALNIICFAAREASFITVEELRQIGALAMIKHLATYFRLTANEECNVSAYVPANAHYACVTS